MQIATVKHAFTLLLEGQPNGATPDELGDWWQAYSLVKQAHDERGHEAAVDAFNVMLRSSQGRGLAQLLAGDVRPKPTPSVPPLPAQTLAVLEHLEPCAGWLDEYVAFASQAAPMTPRAFHEAAGLWLVSTVVARRLYSLSGLGATFPNLFILQIAPPAVYKKTTGLNVAARLLDQVGLRHLLLAQTITPQALVEEMSISIPERMKSVPPGLLEDWIRERSFAAQRAWKMDEAAQLFDSFEREYNTGLHLLILQLFDCENEITAQTTGRGRTRIENAYLSYLGATTPETIRKHLASKALWGSGLWSRFCLVTPDAEPVYAPRPPKTPIPGRLVAGLRRIFDLWPAPVAKWEDGEDDDGKKGPHIVLYNQHEPRECLLGPGVDAALNTYNEQIFHMLRRGAVDPLFHSAYDRLSVHLLKVAMLLATLDSQHGAPLVELRHVARALQIVEGWRHSLHTVYQAIAATDEAHLVDRIAELLAKDAMGLTARELAQRTHRPSAEVRQALALLQEAGQVEASQKGRTTLWIFNAGVASVAECSTGAATLSSPFQSVKP